MKVIITGATGMVGKGVLLECLDSPHISAVLSIGRTPLELQHPKLKELIISDFLNYDSVKTELAGHDAAFLCMGVSSSGMKEDKYHLLTYEYTLSLAQALKSQNASISCTYVSGVGTDRTEKGRIMWARVKGKTENALLNLFNRSYMFRPGAIIPLRGIKSKTKLYQFIYDYFLWALKLMRKMMPNSIVDTTQIGHAMIHSILYDYTKEIIEPKDIVQLAQFKKTV